MKVYRLKRHRLVRLEMRTAYTISQEYIEAFGVKSLIKEAMGYKKGWKGKSYRMGINGDDFARNMTTIVIFAMKVPRSLAPKQRRKNTISNRKLNRIAR